MRSSAPPNYNQNVYEEQHNSYNVILKNNTDTRVSYLFTTNPFAFLHVLLLNCRELRAGSPVTFDVERKRERRERS